MKTLSLVALLFSVLLVLSACSTGEATRFRDDGPQEMGLDTTKGGVGTLPEDDEGSSGGSSGGGEIMPIYDYQFGLVLHQITDIDQEDEEFQARSLVNGNVYGYEEGDDFAGTTVEAVMYDYVEVDDYLDVCYEIDNRPDLYEGDAYFELTEMNNETYFNGYYIDSIEFDDDEWHVEIDDIGLDMEFEYYVGDEIPGGNVILNISEGMLVVSGIVDTICENVQSDRYLYEDYVVIEAIDLNPTPIEYFYMSTSHRRYYWGDLNDNEYNEGLSGYTRTEVSEDSVIDINVHCSEEWGVEHPVAVSSSWDTFVSANGQGYGNFGAEHAFSSNTIHCYASARADGDNEWVDDERTVNPEGYAFARIIDDGFYYGYGEQSHLVYVHATDEETGAISRIRASLGYYDEYDDWNYDSVYVYFDDLQSSVSEFIPFPDVDLSHADEVSVDVRVYTSNDMRSSHWSYYEMDNDAIAKSASEVIDGKEYKKLATKYFDEKDTKAFSEKASFDEFKELVAKN